MNSRSRVSEESLLTFLSGTGLPLDSALTVLRWTAVSLAIGCTAVAALGLLDAGIFDAATKWIDCLAVVLGVPFFLLSGYFVRRIRLQAAAVSLFGGLYLLTLSSTVIRGALTPGWYLQPLLAILATSALGVVPGLSFSALGALAILVSPWIHDPLVPIGIFSRSHSLTLAAVTLLGGLAGVVVHRVLCEAVAAGDELRQREKLLSHALRVETVGDLAGLVVHRLRNDFQVALGHVALGSSAVPEERRHHLEMIGRTLEGASPLLEQLLGLAHPEDGELRADDLNRLAADFVTKAGRILPASVELRHGLATGPLPVLLDPRGLEHALLNLVINARDAMQGSGTLSISTGRREDRVWIAVRDSGPGIPREDLDRIFDPYFTTKPVGQGTGLGLTAVSRYVSSCQGKVRVESEPGSGTVFTLEFPPHGRGARTLEGRATG